MFQKAWTGRPKSHVPLGGASDAFEAEHLYELECIENILLRSNSRAQKRGDDWVILVGGMWKKLRFFLKH